jgi:uncharacterized membrane protein YvbJ
MPRFCPNCGEKIPEQANYCSSCGAYITPVLSKSEVQEKAKEFRENIEIFNLTKQVHVFTVYVIFFTTALYAWEVLNVPTWEGRLFGSLAIAVAAVFTGRFLLNRYLL